MSPVSVHVDVIRPLHRLSYNYLELETKWILQLLDEVRIFILFFFFTFI